MTLTFPGFLLHKWAVPEKGQNVHGWTGEKLPGHPLRVLHKRKSNGLKGQPKEKPTRPGALGKQLIRDTRGPLRLEVNRDARRDLLNGYLGRIRMNVKRGAVKAKCQTIPDTVQKF